MKLVFTLVLWFSASTFLQAQCSFVNNIKIETNFSKSQGGKIILTLNGVEESVTFKLFKIGSNNSIDFVSEKVLDVKSNQKEIVFGSLPISTYFVQAINSDCQRTLGGVEGIKVNESEK